MKRILVGACAMAVTACAAPGSVGAPDASLGGTRWVGVVDSSVAKEATPWIEFLREGRLTGYSGCNMLSGGWSGEGASARLSGLVATKRYCLGAAGDLEKRVLAAMTAESRITREGERLVVTSPGGARFEFVKMVSGSK